MTTLPTLGPPGVYLAPDVVAAPGIGVRMDVCAFVGVAVRGPAWERVDDEGFESEAVPGGRARSVPVAVQSWAEFEEIFGGLRGPGLLPWSVASFFAQGGRRAYVVRVVPSRPRPDPEPAACAAMVFSPAVRSADGKPVRLRARNEGSWGNRLAAVLTFTAVDIVVAAVTGRELVADTALPVGSLLRLHALGVPPVLRTVLATRRNVSTMDEPVAGRMVRAEVVTAILQIRDTDPDRPRDEVFADLGLRDTHPRWLGQVLRSGSRLVELAAGVAAITPATVELAPAAATRPEDGSGDGRDRFADLTPDDVLGPAAVADLAGIGRRATVDLTPDGVDALAGLVDPPDSAAPAALVVADLYQPFPPPPVTDVGVPETLAGAGFGPCTPVPAVPAAPVSDIELSGLRLDPAIPAERARIVALQQRVVAAAEGLGVIALLDVPPGLRPAQVLAWRANFDSAWAAAWHGWLRRPAGPRLCTVPPSGYAAGVIAATERARGLATGPARVTLSNVVAVAEGLGATLGAGATEAAGSLHRAGINLALPDRDGVLFGAARTLAMDPAWRQLTVRRIVAMVERSVATGLDWAVFEPNGRVLRDRVAIAVGNLLHDLFVAGAFAGATPAESYFVRVGEPVPNPGPGEANLLCEIGVAPSEPCEFLVVRVLRADDGTLRTVTP